MDIKLVPKPEGKTFVVEGAELKCTMGVETSKLMLPGEHGIYIHDKKQATVMDFIPMVNIGTFITCKVTKMPCVPVVVMPWINGRMDCTINGNPSLLSSSIAVCSCGGVIKITKDGQ